MTTPTEPAASERIEAAAIRCEDGVVFTLPRPARHHTLLHALAERGDGSAITGGQGFVTDAGRFVDRREGLLIAIAAGQAVRGRSLDLFTEDLW